MKKIDISWRKPVVLFLTLLVVTSSKATDLQGAIDRNVYYGNYIELSKVSDNCYSALWLHYVTGKEVNSSSCELCKSSLERSYNCALFESHYFEQNKDYNRSWKVLNDFLILNNERLDDHENIKNSIEKKLGNLKFLNSFFKVDPSKFDETVLYVDTTFHPSLDSYGSLKSFTVDTAAGHSGISKPLPKPYSSFSISTFYGKEYSVNIGVKDILGSYFPTLFELEENILGVSFLNELASINLIENLKKKSSRSELFRDQNNFFFTGSIEMRGKFIEGANICIDSGSRTTVLMPKTYKIMRDLLQSERVVNVGADEIIGKMIALGKIVPLMKLYIRGDNFSLDNVPILFRANNSLICNLVLGQDFLSKYMKSISIKHRYVDFIKQ
ncbi:hypothetical protein EXT46_05930 [Pseudoalteromonas sp. CO325X]|uniref:hypothetical protein n=1 Tax=Pseudoalteromonas sp. CO325X TaxID=1777262 RepID=UPI001023027B|nr:hypothetical protein [Pseudoalteromonas sp. CO325X]RZF82990.1 hypothetical protein EXT46_05930 [Pseudoalteromonas sp. CO325X]